MARHTGASLDRLEERIPLEEVRRRGRWTSDKSVKRYEKRATAQEVYLSMADQQRKYAHRAGDRFEQVQRIKLDGLATRSSRKRATIG